MPICKNKIVCPFFNRKIPIHDAMYKQNLAKYCEGASETCAIFEVLEKANFLALPKDLYPNQAFRVPEILKRKTGS